MTASLSYIHSWRWYNQKYCLAKIVLQIYFIVPGSHGDTNWVIVFVSILFKYLRIEGGKYDGDIMHKTLQQLWGQKQPTDCTRNIFNKYTKLQNKTNIFDMIFHARKKYFVVIYFGPRNSEDEKCDWNLDNFLSANLISLWLSR